MTERINNILADTTLTDDEKLREILRASPFFGPWMDYLEEKKKQERDTALPAERERPDPFGLFKR